MLPEARSCVRGGAECPLSFGFCGFASGKPLDMVEGRAFPASTPIVMGTRSPGTTGGERGSWAEVSASLWGREKPSLPTAGEEDEEDLDGGRQQGPLAEDGAGRGASRLGEDAPTHGPGRGVTRPRGLLAPCSAVPRMGPRLARRAGSTRVSGAVGFEAEAVTMRFTAVLCA